jgi:hypothetical protein
MMADFALHILETFKTKRNEGFETTI